MRTARFVIAFLIICGLLVFVLQNTSPDIAVVFLGIRTPALPLSVWLGSAIALGALTTLALNGFTHFRDILPQRSRRRRWQVHPDSSSGTSGAKDFNASRPAASRSAASQSASKRDTPRRPASSTSSTRQNRPKPTPKDTAVTEDWQAWGDRTPASQWEDWTQADSPGSTASSPAANQANQKLSKRQRQDREKADNALGEMAEGWDRSAHDTVYVPPGGSTVDDTLDEIADGWDSWDTEDTAPSETAYSYQYRGAEQASRVDAVYGPPDDADDHQTKRATPTEDDNEDWGLDPEDHLNEASGTSKANDDSSDDSEESDGVYDADYRVIIPPHRPLNEDEENRDRTP